METPKVRDLFDSLCRGYPVGFFLFWVTGADGVEAKVIGDTNTRRLPRQAHSLKVDSGALVDLGRKVSGGTLPRLSCDRSVL